MRKKSRLTITEAAKKVGVVPKTIVRWEQSGKIDKAKRDWRGWRVYSPDEVDQLRSFIETVYPA